MSRARTRIPEELAHLIDRMLEPDGSKRIGMQEAAEQVRSFERPSAFHRIWKLAALAAFLTLAVAAVAWLWTYRQSRNRIDLSRMAVRPLASQPGLEDNPSMSPDGLWISCLYRARAVDRPQLQVHSTKDGPPIVIQTGTLVVRGPAAWSPDSSEFFAQEGSREHFIYRVHRSGGVPRRIAGCRSRADSGCELDWSPDGTMLAIGDRQPNNSELYLLHLADGRRRDLIARDKLYVTTPRFSPDGKWIAYLKQPSMTSNDVYVVAAAGGRPRRITKWSWFLSGFSWSRDGRSLLAFSSRESNKPQMWQFSLNGNEQHAVVEFDAGRGSALSLSRGKGSFAWVRDLSINSLWRMHADRSGEPPEPLVNSAAVDIDAEWSRNGRMVFRSDRSGVTELWIANADGSSPWQATRFRGPFVGDPHWSPDGRSIAFTSHATGNPDIFVMQCDGGATTCSKARQLTRSPAPDANPIWSRDGRSIYFSSSRSGEFEVWRMPADGAASPERITWNGGYLARESADGKWLYFSKLWEPTGFWRIPLPSRGPGQPERPVALNVPFKAGASWALGARELFYYPSTEDSAILFPPVRAVDLETGLARDLPVASIRLGRGLSLSPDERWLLRSQNDRALTLIMIAE